MPSDEEQVDGVGPAADRGAAKMNVKLLEKVKRLILEEPQKFIMGNFVARAATSCGTAACIAGWAVIAHDRRRKVRGSETVTDRYITMRDLNWEGEVVGAEVLGLTPEQSNRLFYLSAWPEPFRDEYLKHDEGSAESARVACERIDHFIATSGAE